MKAITIWQPWATLIAIGAKRFETRGWSTRYRGRIAIHAAKKELPNKHTFDPIIETLEEHGIVYHKLPLGCVIATATLSNCLKVEDTWTDGYVLENGERIYFPECEFGDFTPGRYAWELSNVEKLAAPVLVRGAQGLWNWEEGINCLSR